MLTDTASCIVCGDREAARSCGHVPHGRVSVRYAWEKEEKDSR